MEFFAIVVSLVTSTLLPLTLSSAQSSQTGVAEEEQGNGRAGRWTWFSFRCSVDGFHGV